MYFHTAHRFNSSTNHHCWILKCVHYKKCTLHNYRVSGFVIIDSWFPVNFSRKSAEKFPALQNLLPKNHEKNVSYNERTLSFKLFSYAWKFSNHHFRLWTKKMAILRGTSSLSANGNPKKIQNIGTNCLIIQTIGIMD